MADDPQVVPDGDAREDHAWQLLIRDDKSFLCCLVTVVQNKFKKVSCIIGTFFLPSIPDSLRDKYSLSPF